LAAGDLAGLLQPVERRAQRAAGDAQHRGELELGREPVAGPVRAGRQPPAQRDLRVVDQRGSLRRRLHGLHHFIRAWSVQRFVCWTGHY
jgi:hypothetical protein